MTDRTRATEPAGPRRAAVLGSPIAHSLSPVLHRAAFAALGLGAWSYDRFEIDEEALPGFLEGLGPEWAGLSLTMPLKRAVMPLLDEISDTAASVEAVNTVVLTGDGRRIGDNTDIPGLVAALRESGVGAVDSASILGAGATASSAVAALSGLGVQDIVAYVRSEARAAEMRGWGERLGVNVKTVDWSQAQAAFESPLVVATTPKGATDTLKERLPSEVGTLFDVLYDPWPTALAAAWQQRGGAVLSGLDLLVHQAVHQFGLFTGDSRSPLAAMRQAGLDALR
ncbi:shikimate dehydrogenase [Streptomyces tsukubensis]|uniref:Shikimate dehydrogenase n=1 Tax=Streptomyces tsukubensis TaxID=83656 RepID=A0A1V4AFD5_9ACTN|nr:shikimate dehydrogenase [Streptomyces tsukubensis]OON82109.1 shikimate dehydrogenase [Streptomyces tsukubensis]QFR92592.1 shikimate dehydrogenase [Streptomyces tsukubensis]